MSQIITLYNHKGGVSKTTTSFNLAHALAEHAGKKVLLVDSDPQCNLTELALAPVLRKLEEQVGSGGPLGELPGTTVLQALRARFDGDLPQVDVDEIKLVPVKKDQSLMLLRGDVDLNEAEDRLSAAHSQRVTTDMHQRRNYIAVYDMLRRLADKHQFDVVIVDVGPSAGALTRSFFLACDRFLVPVAPDRFNFQAIRSLSRILTKWITEHQTIVDDFRAVGLNVPEGKPIFHGLVMQRYQRYANAPKKSFKIWMDRIGERAEEELVPALIEAAGTSKVIASGREKDPAVANIPDFTGLGPIMLSAGKPVWRITKQDAEWVGKVWTQTGVRLDAFRDLHYELADSITEGSS